jgi:hypothetical protein
MTNVTLLTPVQEPIYKLIISIFRPILFAAHLLVWPSYGDNSTTCDTISPMIYIPPDRVYEVCASSLIREASILLSEIINVEER